MKIVKSWMVSGFEQEPPYQRTLKVLMAPSSHNIKNLSIGMVIIPSGSRSDSHTHEVSEEFWIVVGGRGKAVVGNKEEGIEPGMIIYVPPKTQHILINDSQEPLKIYFVFAPPGPEAQLLAREG